VNEFKSSPFGLEIFYYYKEFRKLSNNLTDLISKNKFESFSPFGISSFFTFRFPIGNLTMFKDYYKIPCGSELKVNNVNTYWYPKFTPIQITLKEALNKIENLLLEGISNLVKEKDKIGFAMSGNHSY